MLHCSSADATMRLPKAHGVVIACSCQDDRVTAHRAWGGVHRLTAGEMRPALGQELIGKVHRSEHLQEKM